MARPCEIPKGYLTYDQWDTLISNNGGYHSCGTAYTTELLRKVEVINAGWVSDKEGHRIRNYVARRMRQDGWNVEVSRAWDPGKGEFACLEAIRQKSYCRKHDPDYHIEEELE